MREFDKIEDCEGNIIQSGDTVYYENRITGFMTEGVIHHMVGGSFGIESKTHRGIYKYTEVNTYKIKKKTIGMGLEKQIETEKLIDEGKYDEASDNIFDSWG